MYREPSPPVSISPIESSEPTDDEYEVRLGELIIDFMNATKLPLSTVTIPEFMNLVNHLNPEVNVPSFRTVIKSATAKTSESTITVMLSTNNNDSTTPSYLKEVPSKAEIDYVMNGTTLKDHPYICLVCLKPRNVSAVKKVVPMDSLIFLLVGLAESLFSLEVAQKLFATPNSRCCASHFKPLVSAVLKLMEIPHPNRVAFCSDETVSIACSVINNIKHPNLPENELPKSGASQFRCSLRAYFKRYDPNNEYMAMTVPEISGSAKAAKPKRKIEVLEGVMRKKKRFQDEENVPEDFLEPLV